jgi:hypothetical protein
MNATEEQTDPRSLVRVLMRGDRATGRQGKDGPLATLTVARLNGLSDAEALELVPYAYAYGYSVALNNEPLDFTDGLCEQHAAVVLAGWQDGAREDPERTLPAAVNP